MRYLDSVLQRWRFRVARPWIPAGGRVLDIGCHQGEFLESLRGYIRGGVGFDPLARPRSTDPLRFVNDRFAIPSAFDDGSFDCVVMLATLEHIRDKERMPREFHRLLAPGGRIIVTVPSPAVDAIVDALRAARMADGMSIDEHHGFLPESARALFSDGGFLLERHRRFQLGLNNLFVFRKPEPEAGAAADGGQPSLAAAGFANESYNARRSCPSR